MRPRGGPRGALTHGIHTKAQLETKMATEYVTGTEYNDWLDGGAGLDRMAGGLVRPLKPRKPRA